MKMAKRDQKDSTRLVQRFVIFHLGLLPGHFSEGFDEAASNAEICEHILYYKEYGKDPPVDHRCRYLSEEAIKFVGLCRAFYSIQTTIDHQMNHTTSDVNEKQQIAETKEIILSTCTLVFIPLEHLDIEGLVAVAQLPRRNRHQQSPASKEGSNDNENPSNLLYPKQIRCKVQKAHDLFKLMNGGGVHRRLFISDTIGNQVVDDTQRKENFAYPGMSELYAGLKQIRKMELQLYHAHALTPDDATKLEQQISVVHEQMNELFISLPIGALRLDLKQFYDSFLRNIGVSEC